MAGDQHGKAGCSALSAGTQSRAWAAAWGWQQLPGRTCALLPSPGRSQVVNRYIDQGVAELVPGVLFIDEVRTCCLAL